jgi:hypothetical protein
VELLKKGIDSLTYFMTDHVGIVASLSKADLLTSTIHSANSGITSIKAEKTFSLSDPKFQMFTPSQK